MIKSGSAHHDHLASTVGRSLYVLLLALFGLSFYVIAFGTIAYVVGLILTRAAHAEGTAPAVIDASYTGAWFDPAQSGHGLVLEVLPDNRFYAVWFTFNPDGTQQAWFGGAGNYSGNTATISDVEQPSGGRWIPDFDPAAIVNTPWGTMTLTFTDRDHGIVQYHSVAGYGSGSMPLERLTSVSILTAPVTPATTFPIGPVAAVATDASGGVYFSTSPGLVYKLDAQGALHSIAGTGVAGYSGDGGSATQAQLNIPLANYPEIVKDPVDYGDLVGGLAIDASGNVYIADAYNNRVRKVDVYGVITTVVGDGTRGYSGDGGPAYAARIYWPQGVAVDTANNVYVSTAYASLRKITPDGEIRTFTGNNCGAGFLGPGLCIPEQIAVDAAGNVFVPDGYCRVRKIAGDGSVVTVAGDDRHSSGGFAFTCGYSGDGGPATKAALSNLPYSVAVDASGNLFIADTGNHCVRKVDALGVIRTVAGICQSQGFGGDGGPATQALLAGPHGVAVDTSGNLYIADTYNYRVRRVTPDGVITTIAGNGDAVAATVPVTIGSGFTGSWFNPGQSGHGLMLEVLPGNRFYATWLAFNPAGQQAWFTGVGTYSGNSAVIADVVQPTDGRWLPNFNPAMIAFNPWGSLTFTFNDCDHGRVDFNSTRDGFGAGSMNLTRLTQPAGITCP